MFVIIWRPESEQSSEGNECLVCAENCPRWGAIGWRLHEPPGPVCVNCLRIQEPQLGELLLLAEAAHEATTLGPALPQLLQHLLHSGYLDAIIASELPERLPEQLEALLKQLAEIIATGSPGDGGHGPVN